MQIMKAINQLNSEKWSKTPAKEKLNFLKQIQKNIDLYFDELIEVDCQVKNINISNKNNYQQIGMSTASTILPIANNLIDCINLYKLIIKKKLPKFSKIKKEQNHLYNNQIASNKILDKILFDYKKAYLQTKKYPKQMNPLKSAGGIIAILGAGNFNSPFEIIRALFIENCVAVYKAHPINKNSISIWKKIFEPLIKYNALSFCNSDLGKELVQNKAFKKIYFTGSTQIAQKILESTTTELVAECGGNNPVIIVPGKNPWTKKEIKHNAKVIATFAKMNGGAVCARPQTLITCKNWPQRNKFLKELEISIKEKTSSISSYYPGTDKKFEKFQQNYPKGKLIKQKTNLPNSNFLLINNIKTDFALKHEAFCQIIDEVTLDTKPQANDFLINATNFCNTKLFGTLACSILINKNTEKIYSKELKTTIKNLNYGSIAINTMPIYVWLNPKLKWGGSKNENKLESGSKSFGNLMCIENSEKSIIYNRFSSNKYLAIMNKSTWFKLSTKLAKYSIKPSWYRLFKLALTYIQTL